VNNCPVEKDIKGSIKPFIIYNNVSLPATVLLFRVVLKIGKEKFGIMFIPEGSFKFSYHFACISENQME